MLSYTRFLKGFVVLHRNLCCFWSNITTQKDITQCRLSSESAIFYLLHLVRSPKCNQIFIRYDQSSCHISRRRISIDFSRKSSYCSWMSHPICEELCSNVEWCLVFESVICQQTRSSTNASLYKPQWAETLVCNRNKLFFMHIKHNLEHPSVMETNRGLMSCSSCRSALRRWLRRTKRCMSLCTTLPTQPIFLSRFTVTFIYLWFSSRMRITAGPR